MKNVKQPSNEKFGFTFVVMLSLLCLYFYYKKEYNISYVCVVIAITLATITLMKPEFLQPFKNYWMKLGYFMGMIINPIILSFMFFIIITPIGIIARLVGHDPLKLKKNILNNSYWTIREDEDLIKKSFENQF